MNIQERLAQIAAAAAEPGGLALRSIARLTDGQPGLLRALEAAAVPHWWEAATLALMLDEDLAPDAANWAKRLCKLSVTEPFLAVPGAYNIHEVTRLALRDKLHAEGRLPALSARALHAIDQTSEDVSSNRAIEQLYHQLLAEPEAGAEALEVAWRDWDNQGRWATLLNLAAMLEEVLPHLAPPARARALLRRATIRSDRGTSTEIKDQAAESLNLFQQLKNERAQSQALNLLGNVATALGNLPEAQRLFSESLSIRQRLAESDPGNARWQRDLSVSLNKLGDVATALGNLPEAQRLFSESLSIRQRLAESDPGNAAWQFDLGISNERLGDLATAQGNLQEAQRFHSARHAIIQRLAASDPGNAAWQRDLSVSLSKLGDVATALGNLPEAQRLFRESLSIRQRLAESDPGNAAWQRDLAQSHCWIGMTRLKQGDLSAAKASFELYRELSQQLAESDPGNAAWQRDLSVSLIKLGDVATALGNLPEAQRLFREDLRIAQRLAELDPGNAEWQRDLAVSCSKLASCHEQQGHPEADEYWRKCLGVFDDMLARGLHVSPQDHNFLNPLRSKLAGN